jgi:L-ascorbate metabolism protein UlaG (beta-lactamase superfamily)
MKRRLNMFLRGAGLPLLLLATVCLLVVGADPPGLTGVRQANGEVLLQFPAPAGQHYRLDVSSDLGGWQPMATVCSTGTVAHTDTAGPYHDRRFYRAVELTGSNILTGDHLMTSAGEVVIHPINHASFVMSWNGKMIYNDPVGAATAYTGIPLADLILVSHQHSDHYSNTTLAAVRNTDVKIFAPQSVYDSMTTPLKAVTTVMANGAVQTHMGLTIEAIAMYNFDDSPHPRGVWNGYVLTIGDKRVYMSGDTEDTPEMRALQNIDVAFLCMSLPSNMTETQAASAARAFRPRVVYPYHFRHLDGTFSDVNSFKQQVSTDLGIEVRMRTWY